MKVEDFDVRVCADTASAQDYLFVSPDFTDWQSKVQGKTRQSFGVFRKDNQQQYARLTLAGKDGIWSAPVTGTFGGPTLDKPVPIAALDRLMIEALRWLKEEAKADSCFIRLPPASFPDPSLALMQNVLHRGGWRLDQMDINYHLPVVPVERFHAQLGATKRQETRRLKGSGATFEPIPFAEAKRVYDIIASNRAARGYPMTMSWDALSAVAQAFCESFHFFGIVRRDRMLASAICIHITPQYLYVFYWGEDPEFRREMPVLLLVDGLVDFAYQNDITVIDIGISTDQSIPNEGLIEFKTALGFQPTPKLTYRFDFK